MTGYSVSKKIMNAWGESLAAREHLLNWRKDHHHFLKFAAKNVPSIAVILAQCVCKMKDYHDNSFVVCEKSVQD